MVSALERDLPVQEGVSQPTTMLTGRRLVLVPHVAVETPRSIQTATRKSQAWNLGGMHFQVQDMWGQCLGKPSQVANSAPLFEGSDTHTAEEDAAQDQPQANHDSVESGSEVEASVIGDREAEVLEEEERDVIVGLRRGVSLRKTLYGGVKRAARLREKKMCLFFFAVCRASAQAWKEHFQTVAVQSSCITSVLLESFPEKILCSPGRSKSLTSC